MKTCYSTAEACCINESSVISGRVKSFQVIEIGFLHFFPQMYSIPECPDYIINDLDYVYVNWLEYKTLGKVCRLLPVMSVRIFHLKTSLYVHKFTQMI